uniref:G-protein coupled receptors family 1 profile domain-containing protein n=1 Tax=Romanomermis culicivorax TaxID=13658 RepID=A0A915L276_ROMCU
MSVNLSTPEQYFLPLWRHSAPITTFYFAVFGLVFLTGLSGNLLVLGVFLLKPGMRMVTSYFISSLALADLFVMIFCLPTTLTNNIFVEWHFGEIFCKFSVWINSSSVCASVYTLVAVAVDR